jgi:hypothetical protein
MVFIVYGKEMDVRQRRERAMTAFKKRLVSWTDERHELLTALGDYAARRFRQTLDKVAIEELDQLVRLDTTRPNGDAPRAVPPFSQQTTPEFEATLEEWFLRRGAKIQIAEMRSADELHKALDGMKEAPKLKPGRRNIEKPSGGG